MPPLTASGTQVSHRHPLPKYRDSHYYNPLSRCFVLPRRSVVWALAGLRPHMAMYALAVAHTMTVRRPGSDKLDTLANATLRSPERLPSSPTFSSLPDIPAPVSASSMPSNGTSPTNSHSRSPSASPIATAGSKSPSLRHPLERPLSPDLPTKDALYLFVNFASYMQSPGEGGEGIVSNEDFKDTIRLLDYARVSEPGLGSFNPINDDCCSHSEPSHTPTSTSCTSSTGSKGPNAISARLMLQATMSSR